MIIDPQQAKQVDKTLREEAQILKMCPICGWHLSNIGPYGLYRACLACWRIFDARSILEEKKPIEIMKEKPE